MDRSRQVETVDSLRRTLELTMNVAVTALEPDQSLAIWNAHAHFDEGRPKAAQDGESAVVFVYDPASASLAHALRVVFPSGPYEHDIRFCRNVSKVFNEDLARCRLAPETDELWQTLSTSRALRAIARFIPFTSSDASEWLRLLESSTSLTYEGTPVRYTVIFVKDFNEAKSKLGSLLVQFHEPLEIGDALLRQKWIRAAVDSRRLALVATKKHKGRIAGLVSYSALPLEQPAALYAPHESFLALQAFLETGEMAVTVSPHGDLWVLLGSGIVFVRTQGEWFYLNYHHAHVTLTNIFGESLTTAVLRAVLDLSFERSGALLCVPDKDPDVDQMVSDRGDEKRVNRAFRDSLAGLSVLNWEERQVIAATASVDGATILSRSGKLLDVACMIARPPPERIREVTGRERAETHSGARSTAAWNASIFGTSLKVSDDGPITVYRHGRQILRIGAGT